LHITHYIALIETSPYLISALPINHLHAIGSSMQAFSCNLYCDGKKKEHMNNVTSYLEFSMISLFAGVRNDLKAEITSSPLRSKDEWTRLLWYSS
jgi:hypothetical protein